MAGTSPDPARTNTDTRSSQPNQASRNPDLSYPLVSSRSFSSSSLISLFLVHNSTIIAEHKVKSSLSISPWHDHELTPITAYTEYSIHPRLFVFPSFSWLRVDPWMHIQLPAYLLTWFPWLRVNQLMNRVSSPGAPSIDRLQVLIQSRSNTPSKCISEVAQLRPPSSHEHGLQVHLQTRSITASKCISEFTRSTSPSASLSSLDRSLQVHTQSRTITASKCISGFTRSTSPSASLSSLDLSLQVHIPTRSISASKCISEFTRSTSPSACQSRSMKYIFNERWRLYGDTGVTEVDRVTGSILSRPRSITACSQSRYSVCRWVAI